MHFTGMTPLIQVFDITKSLAFYTDTLGLHITAASPEIDAPEGRFSHFVWLKSGPIELMLNTACDTGERPDHPDPARSAFHGDTCLFFACPDLDSVHAKPSVRATRNGATAPCIWQ